MTTIEFNYQFAQYKKVLTAFALKLAQTSEDAKDLMQETALKAFSNRRQFKIGSNFRAWVLVIMRNTYINEWRKKKRRGKETVQIEDYLFSLPNLSVTNTGEEKLAVAEIQSAINTTSQTYRIPFQMYTQGYQYKEIAHALNLPVGTIKSRIFFARKQIQKQILVQQA